MRIKGKYYAGDGGVFYDPVRNEIFIVTRGDMLLASVAGGRKKIGHFSAYQRYNIEFSKREKYKNVFLTAMEEQEYIGEL